MRAKWHSLIVALMVLVPLGACATSPPDNVNNACEIFREKSGWFKAMDKAQARWGASIGLQLAIIRQESAFVHNAKPPRKHILWVIPWGRQSDAYGYPQAKDDTWDWYRDKSGRRGADRNDLGDAADFVSWYVAQTYRLTGTPKHDAFHQYLAYHDGHGGFQRGTWRSKQWLIGVARKVERNTGVYNAQIAKCRDELEGPWWWPF